MLDQLSSVVFVDNILAPQEKDMITACAHAIAEATPGHKFQVGEKIHESDAEIVAFSLYLYKDDAQIKVATRHTGALNIEYIHEEFVNAPYKVEKQVLETGLFIKEKILNSLGISTPAHSYVIKRLQILNAVKD